MKRFSKTLSFFLSLTIIATSFLFNFTVLADTVELKTDTIYSFNVSCDYTFTPSVSGNYTFKIKGTSNSALQIQDNEVELSTDDNTYYYCTYYLEKDTEYTIGVLGFLSDSEFTLISPEADSCELTIDTEIGNSLWKYITLKFKTDGDWTEATDFTVPLSFAKGTEITLAASVNEYFIEKGNTLFNGSDCSDDLYSNGLTFTIYEDSVLSLNLIAADSSKSDTIYNVNLSEDLSDYISLLVGDSNKMTFTDGSCQLRIPHGETENLKLVYDGDIIDIKSAVLDGESLGDDELQKLINGTYKIVAPDNAAETHSLVINCNIKADKLSDSQKKLTEISDIITTGKTVTPENGCLSFTPSESGDYIIYSDNSSDDISLGYNGYIIDSTDNGVITHRLSGGVTYYIFADGKITLDKLHYLDKNDMDEGFEFSADTCYAFTADSEGLYSLGCYVDGHGTLSDILGNNYDIRQVDDTSDKIFNKYLRKGESFFFKIASDDASSVSFIAEPKSGTALSFGDADLDKDTESAYFKADEEGYYCFSYSDIENLCDVDYTVNGNTSTGSMNNKRIVYLSKDDIILLEPRSTEDFTVSISKPDVISVSMGKNFTVSDDTLLIADDSFDGSLSSISAEAGGLYEIDENKDCNLLCEYSEENSNYTAKINPKTALYIETDKSTEISFTEHIHCFTLEIAKPELLKSPANCSSGAVYYKSCSGCGLASDSDTFISGKPTEHNWDSGTVITEPSCTHSGEIRYTCLDNSEHTKTEILYSDPDNHTSTKTVKENVTEADCDSAGRYDEVIYCNDCGAELSRTERKIPKLEHNIVTRPAVDATCYSTGLTEGSYCSLCGTIITEQQITPPNSENHKLQKISSVTPSCIESGNIEYYQCQYCQKCFLDSDGKIVSDADGVILQPTGHLWGKAKFVRSATCISEGEILYTCKNDSSHTMTVTVPINKSCHMNLTNEISNKKSSSCSEEGGYDEIVKCRDCGKTVCSEHITIPKTDHTAVIDKAVAPTYRTTGLTEGSHCSVCGEVIKQQTVVPMLAKTSLSSCTVTISRTVSTWTGKALTCTVNVKNGGTVIPSSNYTVTYSNNTNVGTASVTITAKSGNYPISGSVKKTFTIIPKSTAMSSLKAGTKSFTAKWSKQASQTTGYQLQYALNSKFTGAKTVIINKNTTVSKTVSGLTAKKTYYVRVRTYKLISGAYYCSSWSSYKTVKTK